MNSDIIELKEDGLNYAYRFRLRILQGGVWKVNHIHYDRKSVIDSYEGALQYSESTCSGLVVEEYFEGQWVVSIDWLEKYMKNNRHNITWEMEEF